MVHREIRRSDINFVVVQLQRVESKTRVSIRGVERNPPCEAFRSHMTEDAASEHLNIFGAEAVAIRIHNERDAQCALGLWNDDQYI